MSLDPAGQTNVPAWLGEAHDLQFATHTVTPDAPRIARL
jgi:hypothetical protein